MAANLELKEKIDRAKMIAHNPLGTFKHLTVLLEHRAELLKFWNNGEDGHLELLKSVNKKIADLLAI